MTDRYPEPAKCGHGVPKYPWHHCSICLYEHDAEFKRLKQADVDQGKRIAQMTEELTQLRLELQHNEAIRESLIVAARETSADAVKAINAALDARKKLAETLPVVAAAMLWVSLGGDDEKLKKACAELARKIRAS